MPVESPLGGKRRKVAAVSALVGLLLGVLSVLGVIPHGVVQPVVDAVEPVAELFA